MSDHDESMPEELHDRLAGVASTIDVGQLEHERSKVDGVVGRRRTRRRVGATLGAVAVVAAGATLVLTAGGSEPDTFATTDDTLSPVTVPDDSVDAPEPTLEVPAAAAGQPVELSDVAAGGGSSAGANGAPQYGEWMVPWEDGFLVGSLSYQPQPLPDELPEEVVALFPQEVIDLFGGDLPATISEATEQLSDAGLLDTVTEVIRNNTAASEAIYGADAAPPTLDVRYTVDGVTWEPRDMVVPPGATYFSTVAAVDDRLAVVYSNIDPATGAAIDGTVTVATTSDLSNWTEQDIVVPSPGELPDGINWSVYSQGLVANDNGWVLSVSDSIDADPYLLLPPDVREEIDAGNGFGFGTTDTGITIDYGFDSDGGNPAASRTFTWDELGVAPEVGQLVSEQDYSPTLWAATWDGQPTLADAPPMMGPIASTPAGFVQWTDQTWFSTDGITWTASPLPEGASWMSGAFNIDGGLIVTASTESGESVVYRVDERGENAVLLDLPLPDSSSLSMTSSFGGSATSGAVVSVDPLATPDERLSVDVDGYRLALPGPAGMFEVTDLATGEVVVSENLFGPDEEGGWLTMDEAGITVTDPTTGDVLVVFSQDALDSAESLYFDRGGGEYSPDFWLLASLDGERFVLEDLDDVTDGPISAATNGSRLLLQSGGNWITYDLA